jgi:hypothetical protein
MWAVAPVRVLLICNGILYSGIALQATALLKQAYDITGRKSDLGWMGLSEFVPIFALVLVSGSVADHFKRKSVALVTVGAEVFTSAALMLYALSQPTSVKPLFLIAFAFGVARAFQAPAMRSMPPMVAPDGALPKVIALYSATWTGASIVGPAIGGFLYAVRPWVAYAGSTALIFFAWASPHRATPTRGPPCGPRSKGWCSSGARLCCWRRSRSTSSLCSSVARWRSSR